MTISKPETVIVLIFLLLATVSLAEGDNKVNVDNKVSINAAEKTVPPKLDCGAACAARCRLASRQHLCKRACGTCCARCNCVPPGTSGNEDVCPCYANMTTHGGRHKCP